MKIVKKLLFSSLLISYLAISIPVHARYTVGKVRDFTDFSRPGVGLNVRSNVPTSDQSIQHYFSALSVYDQQCEPGKACFDVMDRVYSDWSHESQYLKRDEPYCHTTGQRKPRVEGYRTVQ